MHGSILLVTCPPPPAHPRGFAIFSFLEIYSSPPGTQIEPTIPHPRALDRPHIRVLLHLFYPYKSKTTRFYNFYERFPEFIERRIMDVIMQLKFENENEEEKLFKKRLLDRTLHENTGSNRCFSLYISKALYSFSYKKLSLFKPKLKKYFCPSFPENKIHSRTHHTHIRFKF